MLRWLRAERRRRLWLLPRKFNVYIHELEYQQHRSAPMLVRVYRPIGVTAFAAALDVHGGNWTSGDRLQQELLDRALAANGVLVAAIDYRLAPPDAYPASVQDVHVATRWLRLHASELGARAGARVGAVGSSAGGHLAILSAMRQPTQLDFVVADAPITDTSSYGERHPYWPTREAAIHGSPMHVLERGEAKALPPLLITHGTQDDAVPMAMSRWFVERYRAAGGHAELRVFDGMGHAFVLTHPRTQESRHMAQAVLQFVIDQSRL